LSIVNGCATDALASDWHFKERKSAGRREPLAVQRIEVPGGGKKSAFWGGGNFEKPRFASPLLCLAPHAFIPALSQEILGAPNSGWPCRFRNRAIAAGLVSKAGRSLLQSFRLEKVEACQQRGFQRGRDAIRFRTLVADMETGDLSTWSRPDIRAGPPLAAVVFDSGTATATVDVASPPTAASIRRKLYNQYIESRRNLYQRCPIVSLGLSPKVSPSHYSAGTTSRDGTFQTAIPPVWNVFQWKSKRGGASDLFFALNVGNRPDGSMYFYLYNQNTKTSSSRRSKTFRMANGSAWKPSTNAPGTTPGSHLCQGGAPGSSMCQMFRRAMRDGDLPVECEQLTPRV